MSAQNIIRTAQTSNFTVLPNAIWNTGLSVAAVSALGYLLSKPPTWRLRITDLRNKLGIGRDKVYKALNELVRAGYAKMTRLQRGVRWQFFDTPQTDATPDTADPTPKSRLPEIQFTEKPEAIEKNEILPLERIEITTTATEKRNDPARPEKPPFVVVSLSEVNNHATKQTSVETLTIQESQPCEPVLSEVARVVHSDLSTEIDKLPLAPKEKRIAERTLSNLTLPEVKAILCVYAAALSKGGIANKIGYLVQLTRAVKNGTLTPVETNQPITLEERIARERQRKAEAEARGRVSNEQWANWIKEKFGIIIEI